MPMQAHPKETTPLPEVDTSLFNPSFQLESPHQESPFNIADLLAGLMRFEDVIFLVRRLNLSLIPGLLVLDNDNARQSQGT